MIAIFPIYEVFSKKYYSFLNSLCGKVSTEIDNTPLKSLNPVNDDLLCELKMNSTRIKNKRL